MRRLSRSLPRASRGLSLLEVVVVLLLTGLLVVGTVSVLLEHRRIDYRARAQREALRVIEAQHEALRSGGAFPQVRGSHLLPLVLTPDDALDGFRQWLEVEPRGSGLYDAVLLSRYEIGGEPFEQRHELRLWRAP